VDSFLSVEMGCPRNGVNSNPPRTATGENSLRRALEYDSEDFDALASLGGILKRQGRYDEAAGLYGQAAEASFGHPYPLLNRIVLQARAEGRLSIDARTYAQLERAARTLEAQVAHVPPYDAPWSFFDLALTRLLLRKTEHVEKAVQEGLRTCQAAWQPRTFRGTLKLLSIAGVDAPVLATVVEHLTAALDVLPDDQ
jgi:tetratricopeptide (TPR) repeat protein